MSCKECEKLRELANNQNLVIERQWSMLKTNNDLIETMSEALWPQPKGEEKTMIHD